MYLCVPRRKWWLSGMKGPAHDHIGNKGRAGLWPKNLSAPRATLFTFLLLKVWDHYPCSFATDGVPEMTGMHLLTVLEDNKSKIIVLAAAVPLEAGRAGSAQGLPLGLYMVSSHCVWFPHLPSMYDLVSQFLPPIWRLVLLNKDPL